MIGNTSVSVARLVAAGIGVLLLASAADLSACAMPAPCDAQAERCQFGSVITCCSAEHMDDTLATGPSASFRVRRDMAAAPIIAQPLPVYPPSRSLVQRTSPVHGYRSVDLAILTSALLI